MTATAALVEDISGYTEGVDYTLQQITRFFEQAEDQFAEDNPGLTGDQADEAVALLVCDRIACRKSKGGEYSVEKIRNWQGTRSTGAGETTWLKRYQNLIAGQTEQPSAGVTRSDRIVSRAFNLSEQHLPRVPGRRYR